ncbi:MAG: TMEM175 family protein [Gemmatimonadaceae bacterium]
MGKFRLEAFSDGVIAIIITIMVLEMKVPHGDSLEVLRPLLPVFLSYVLSFVYVGIYWNNHHHLLHACRRVSGGILWANLHLLFWLSLFPFATGWMGENHFGALPTAVYGVVCLMAAISYTILQMHIIRADGSDSALLRAVGADVKGKFSLGCYVVAVAIAAWVPQLSLALYVTVALTWFIPDRRIERALGASGTEHA